MPSILFVRFIDHTQQRKTPLDHRDLRREQKTMNKSQSDELDSYNSLIEMKTDEIDKFEPKLSKETSEERINLIRVINTFKSYADVNKTKLNDKIKYFESLPSNHQVIFN